MEKKKIKLLIVDDSIVFRKILTDILSAIPDIDIVGKASNGKSALDMTKQLKPDLVSLDVEMPIMDGLETLKYLKKDCPRVAVVMVSSLTKRGATTTMKALDLGALDFITKPDSSDIERNKKDIEMQFKPILNIFKIKRSANSILEKPKSITPDLEAKQAVIRTQSSSYQRQDTIQSSPRITPKKPEILAIGISTGGPKALQEVIPKLPANFPLPVLIVQHMPPIFTRALADSLQKKSTIKISEAENGSELLPGNVYIAPGGKHMRLKKILPENTHKIEITDDPPENHCKPSVDYTFRSLSKFYPGKTLGVIMTGMGNDGVTGLRLLKRHGANVIAQDEETCVVYGMPAEAYKAGVVDFVLPLQNIAEKIMQLIK